MVKQGSGALVQIGTSSSLRVKEGFGALGAVQHALRALTIAAAKELRPQRVHVAHLPCDGGIESGKTANYTAKVGAESLQVTAGQTVGLAPAAAWALTFGADGRLVP